jgi:hypothetical protein
LFISSGRGAAIRSRQCGASLITPRSSDAEFVLDLSCVEKRFSAVVDPVHDVARSNQRENFSIAPIEHFVVDPVQFRAAAAFAPIENRIHKVSTPRA